MYQEFEDWFYELESTSIRAERFYKSLSQFHTLEGKLANLRTWLNAAFDAGKSK